MSQAYKNIVENRMKRVRRRILITAIIISVLVFFIGLKCGSLLVKAAVPHTRTGYVEYCIRPGDTLWTISEKYYDASGLNDKKEYLKEVKQINHLASVSEIVAGQYLILPLYE